MPPKEEPTEPVFDIDYLISFAKSYAESIGLTLDSGAVYCWDNPIAAGVKCKYTERDIRGYLDRYAKDGDIRLSPSLFLRWAMWAVSRIGLGMASEAV